MNLHHKQKQIRKDCGHLKNLHWSSVKKFSCLKAIDFALEASLKFWPVYIKSILCSISQVIKICDKRCGN